MIKNTINGKGKKLYYYKAGIMMGSEEYINEPMENGYRVDSHTQIADYGSETRQNCSLILDKEYNTLNMDVKFQSKDGYESYTFNYNNSEAHVLIEQKRGTPDKDKTVDQTLVWDNKVLVIPSAHTANAFMFLEKKYSFEKKGIQDIACSIVPKVIFKMEYLGEDLLEVGESSVSCKRYQVKYSRSGAVVNLMKGGLVVNMWINEQEDIFRLLITENMMSIQSYKN